MGVLARNGYEFTPHAEEADVIVVNHLQLHRADAKANRSTRFWRWPNIKNLARQKD